MLKQLAIFIVVEDVIDDGNSDGSILILVLG
jgi:hypothetical protein